MTGMYNDVITTYRTYLRIIPKAGTYTRGLLTFTQVCVSGGSINSSIFSGLSLSPVCAVKTNIHRARLTRSSQGTGKAD